MLELLFYRLLARFQKKRAPYVLVGGKKGLMALVNTFYDVMENAPEAKQTRDLHPENLNEARKRLYMFLSGWFGGPNLYWKAYGHPKMRARHMKFAIGPRERDQWIWCMQKAVDSRPFHPEFKAYIMKSFIDFSHHMQNRQG